MSTQQEPTRRCRPTIPLTFAAAALLAAGFAGCARPLRKPAPPSPGISLASAPVGQWTPFFDGKTLKSWLVVKEGEFETHGKVEVKDGALHMGSGMPFTAIAWTGDFPTESYEVEVEAMRTSGADIFCGLTFPVAASHCSLVLGGWGDTVVGISCVDDMLANENDTTKVMSFENNKWVRVRARVTEEKIECWIGDEQVVDLDRKDRKFSVYPGIELLAPFGIFTWQTDAALRNFRLRRLKAAPNKSAKVLPALPTGDWKSLFDGKTLGGWCVAEENEFALHGKVFPTGDRLTLCAGEPMSGVAWTREFPRIGYELALDAMRVEGGDFFCGLTFPVGAMQCTLILGGWGGSVVGLSNIDGFHAAENQTTQSVNFANSEWYRVRLRVTKANVEVWIDGKRVISQATKGHKFTIWPQQEPMKPLGIATYYTKAAIRNIQFRTLGSSS